MDPDSPLDSEADSTENGRIMTHAARLDPAPA